MDKKKIKIAETNIAKQLSAYTLIHYDLEFSCRAFTLAANFSDKKKKIDTEKCTQSRVSQIAVLDPILRMGATVALLDRNQSETSTLAKTALFEAAIISYARCFNMSKRTSLTAKVFKGKLSPSLKRHEKIIKLRNEHIAHTELKYEQSIIGFQLVNDPAYGNRPSAVFSGLKARRAHPPSEDLHELRTHCQLVDEQVVQPILLKKAKALREELLNMSDEEIMRMRNYGESGHDIDPFFS